MYVCMYVCMYSRQNIITNIGVKCKYASKSLVRVNLNPITKVCNDETDPLNLLLQPHLPSIVSVQSTVAESKHLASRVIHCLVDLLEWINVQDPAHSNIEGIDLLHTCLPPCK